VLTFTNKEGAGEKTIMVAAFVDGSCQIAKAGGDYAGIDYWDASGINSTDPTDWPACAGDGEFGPLRVTTAVDVLKDPDNADATQPEIWEAVTEYVQTLAPEGFSITYREVETAGWDDDMMTDATLNTENDQWKAIVFEVKYTFANFAEYFTTGLGSPETMSAQGIGLASTGWGPDYSSALSFWAPLIDGRKIKPSSNQNFAELDLDEINALLDSLEAAQTSAEAAGLNRKIEELVMQEAVYLPYAVDRMVLYRPKALTDIYVQIALGNQYDLVNIGKQDIPQ
jgi:ABC-type oligopeptide transport system substrate-binding subunit